MNGLIARFIGAHHHKGQTELLVLTTIKGRIMQSTEREKLVFFLSLYLENNMNTTPDSNPYFYYVDGNYIEYLKECEIQKRGFTCVPNAHYWNTDKFVFGAVLCINDLSYFVPVSSYSRKQQDLILIKDKKDKHILGSLRFNFMIPVPNNLLHKLDINNLPTTNNRVHTSKELAFCRRNRDKIYKFALKTYNRVKSGNYPELNKNSCDFELLEKASLEYEKR